MCCVSASLKVKNGIQIKPESRKTFSFLFQISVQNKGCTKSMFWKISPGLRDAFTAGFYKNYKLHGVTLPAGNSFQVWFFWHVYITHYSPVCVFYPEREAFKWKQWKMRHRTEDRRIIGGRKLLKYET